MPVIGESPDDIVGVISRGEIQKPVVRMWLFGFITTIEMALRERILRRWPEGGWEEPYELDMFKSRGFQQISLGTRVLRSDVAVVSLLALAHEACAADCSE